MIETVAEKPEWLERMEAYQKHLLEGDDASAYLVSAADRLHNARETVVNVRNEAISVWSRFSTKERAL